jgi:hypothetical protein
MQNGLPNTKLSLWFSLARTINWSVAVVSALLYEIVQKKREMVSLIPIGLVDSGTLLYFVMP